MISEVLWIPFWIAFLVSAVAAWPIYRLLLLTKSRQNIDPHAPEGHRAKQGTPTMGGLIVVVGAVAAVAFSIIEGGPEKGSGTALQSFLMLLIGFGTIGFIDDFLVPRLMPGKRGLGVAPKLLMQIVLAALAVCTQWGFGLDLHRVLGVFLILFFSNAFNFVDGLDGLSGSVWLGLATGLIGLLAVGDSTAGFSVVGAISGGIVTFLFLNAPPAKVFMGDAGSLPIGACLGWIIANWLVSPGLGGRFEFYDSRLLPVVMLSLLMIAELVPVPMQVAYYKLTKGKRLFPMTPIHHAFEKKGWKESRVVWTFALFQLLISMAAITINGGLAR